MRTYDKDLIFILRCTHTNLYFAPLLLHNFIFFVVLVLVDVVVIVVFVCNSLHFLLILEF